MKGVCFEIFSSGVGFCLFGSTGNLAKKKIIPALCNMYLKEYLRENFFVLNIGSKDFDDNSFRSYLSKVLDEVNIKDYGSFLERNYYFKMDYSSIDSYNLLREKIRSLCLLYSTNIKVFYLSIIPSQIKKNIENLLESGNIDQNTKIIIEKPYGENFKDALVLVDYLKEVGLEDRIYRIDHYTGKDGIINILLLRMLNYAFEKTFNNLFIDNVQITIYENIGIEGRKEYFENTGIFKDMFSHLLQIISFISMDIPNTLKPYDVKSKKIDLIDHIEVADVDFISKNWIRAQYKSYKDEVGVTDSDTETFVAFKLYISSERWKDVPFYVKIGKKMKEKLTRVDLVYKKIVTEFSEKYSIDSSNVLTFYIQPEVKMSFSFIGKVPGPKFCVSDYLFSLSSSFETYLAPSDYERLLIDCINSDKTLFISDIEVKKMWEFIKNYDLAKKEGCLPLLTYEDNSDFLEVERITALDGRKWIYI